MVWTVGAEMSDIGGELLTLIENENPRLGQLFRRYEKAISTLSTNTGASATGYVPPPDAPQNVIVNKIGDEHLQITVEHTSPVNKGIEYFAEISTQGPGINPRVEHLGASRAPANPIFLPTKDLSGNTHQYHLTVYAQQPGSPPSNVHVYSGNPITMSGTTEADHTPSTGSGTAAPNGSQGGSGWGKVLQRPAPAPKRVTT